MVVRVIKVRHAFILHSNANLRESHTRSMPALIYYLLANVPG